MEDLGSIVANNLIYLRKKSGLTQLEFGQKVNYSDKTVSKWELGSVVPSIETLKQIADFYNVSIDYLISEHHSQKEYESTYAKAINPKHKITIMALLVSIILCIVVVIYVAGYINLKTLDPNINRYWLSFVWFLPVSFLILSYFTNKFFKKSKWTTIFLSLAVWTLLLSAYLTFLDADNYWFLFIIGFPVQAVIIFIANLMKHNK